MQPVPLSRTVSSLYWSSGMKTLSVFHFCISTQLLSIDNTPLSFVRRNDAITLKVSMKADVKVA